MNICAENKMMLMIEAYVIKRFQLRNIEVFIIKMNKLIHI